MSHTMRELVSRTKGVRTLCDTKEECNTQRITEIEGYHERFRGEYHAVTGAVPSEEQF